MEQKIEPLTPEDTVVFEKQRDWVRGHYASNAHQNYESLEGKLSLLEKILEKKWVEPNETWKLQSLGITFGDALAQKMTLSWVAVEDKHGRDPALKDADTAIVVFPLTTISKRVERGEAVDVRDLFAKACITIERLRSELSQHKT